MKQYDAMYMGQGENFSLSPIKANKTMNSRVKELLSSPIAEMRALGRVVKEEEDIKRHIYLNVVNEIQQKHPLAIVTGSAALYLHGLRLDRLRKNWAHDLDLILPFYIKLEDIRGLEINGDPQGRRSSDFDYSLPCRVEGQPFLIDIIIDPKSKWEYIEMDDFKYKVNLVEEILAAKIKYMQWGNMKHKDDLYEILGKKTIIPEPEPSYKEWSGGS